jgi:adenosylmethionine-8-amino-7-oxononanoate aminotransferase
VTVDAILAADRAHLWHPYTPMDEWRARHDPLLVVRAEGPWLHLASGERLLDANGSWWVSTLGHNHPRLVSALKAQADRMCHVALAGITHEPAAMLSKELAAVAPAGLDQVFFSDDGSTAIEAAVKMALQFFAQNGRPEKVRFIALDGAFHGETLGATSLGGVEVFRRPFASVVFDCVHVPSPAGEDVSCAPLWGEAFDAIAELVEREHATIAAVVLEPLVQGAAGMRMYPPAYLRAVRDLCTRHDVLLIVDEVFTGYGRLGAMWACDLAQISPDLMCIAKGFTGGVLPMAATLTTRRVLAGFDGGRGRAFLYGHSYTGNALGAAVAREVLAIYRDERVVDGVAARHASIAGLAERLRGHPLVRDARSLGAIGAFELREVRATTTVGRAAVDGARRAVATAETTDDLGYTASIGWRVYDEARRRGAYLRPLGNVVYVTPPLNIPLDALERLLAIVEESIEAASR